jgi:hypothetical protein
MKNVIKNLAAFGLCLIIIGLIFKSNYWPGASIVFLIGGLVLSISFILEISQAEKNERWSSFFLNLGLSTFILHFLFKFLHWPGAAILCILSLGIMIPIYGVIKAFTTAPKGGGQEKSGLQVVIQQLSRKLHWLSFSLLSFGSIIWVLHLPGGGAMFTMSMLFAVCYIFTGVLLYASDETPPTFGYQHFVRIMVGFCFILGMYISRVPKSILNHYSTMHEDIQQNMDQELTLAESYMANMSDSVKQRAELINKETAEVVSFISDLQLQILHSQGEDVRTVKAGDEHFVLWNKPSSGVVPLTLNSRAIQAKDNFDIPMYILLGSNGTFDKNGRAKELWERYGNLRIQFIGALTGQKVAGINDFSDHKSLLQKTTAMLRAKGLNDQQVSSSLGLYMKLSKPEKVKGWEQNQTVHWMTKQFDHAPTVYAIMQLSKMQLEVLQARTMALRILSER